LYLDWMREMRTRQATVIGRDTNRLDFWHTRHSHRSLPQGALVS
jgi:hypothetical protein